MNRPPNQRPTRSAFTLIELVLVMAVIVTILSLAVPAVIQSLAARSLSQSADRVRVAMGKARVEAIRSGEIHALFFEPNGNWFGVDRFSAIQSQPSIATAEKRRVARSSHSALEDNILPRGIVFAVGETSVDSRSADAFNQQQPAGGNIQPVIFYPDGTSQDAKIYLRNDKQKFVAVELRGLTGVAQTVNVPPGGSGNR